MPVSSTGLLFDERFFNYDLGADTTVVMRGGSFQLDPEPRPSSVQILRRTRQFLEGAGLSAQMQPIGVRAATDEELTVYHTAGYLAGLRAYVQGGPAIGEWGEIDKDDLPQNPAALEAAFLAAGGAIEAVRAVLAGNVRHAYALLRPPGHHALSNRCLGYCVFNNAVVAAHYARRAYGLERIMIVDWDVHHGNGTQDAFYSDPGVLFVSLHQHNWYPKLSGELDQVGRGAGAGYTVNIPLPAGTGDRGYQAAFEQLVVPIGLRYRPQLLIISAGQDANWLDPLAQMCMTMTGFRTLAALMLELASQVCDGRLVFLQEGGYSVAYTPYCTGAVIEALLGLDLGIVDLYAGTSELERSSTVLTQATRDALAEARAWHRNWWQI
jgi:acetoin utilization deacetylase AcuC-like enzyme